MTGLRLSRNIIKVSTGAVAAAMISAAVPEAMLTVSAAHKQGWREENGVKYWYEDGVRQGVKLKKA